MADSRYLPPSTLRLFMDNVPPVFDESFRKKLSDLVTWRRRRFRTSPVPEALLDSLIHLASLSPSVGYSQPWRFVRVQDPGKRSAIRSNFDHCNRAALDSYEGERAELYARLKLAGLDTAPEQVAVFCDMEAITGYGPGRRMMPEMHEYSVVIACHTLWLASRAYGVGMGWISILSNLETFRSYGL